MSRILPERAKCTLTNPGGFVLLCTSLYFVNRHDHFGFKTHILQQFKTVCYTASTQKLGHISI